MTVTTLSYSMVICGSSYNPPHRFRSRIEKVKFGVPIQEAFACDIPAILLILLLKVNKDGPSKKDIWRAPGNQAQVRKLSHIMQHGRLVNIANYSVYTVASVIKKFLSKLPGGIFGLENEQRLFELFYMTDSENQRQVFCRVVSSLPLPSQHLIVLLFGTFFLVSDAADVFNTRMTPDAIGISVAPTLFHSCIHDEQRAAMEDVMRYKMASEVISKIIQSFGYVDLFPSESYEFYARITGRAVRVSENGTRLKFPPATDVDVTFCPASQTNHARDFAVASEKICARKCLLNEKRILRSFYVNSSRENESSERCTYSEKYIDQQLNKQKCILSMKSPFKVDRQSYGGVIRSGKNCSYIETDPHHITIATIPDNSKAVRQFRISDA